LLIQPALAPQPYAATLTPIEMLTPASDGNYYHPIQSGETLLLIANLYEDKA